MLDPHTAVLSQTLCWPFHDHRPALGWCRPAWLWEEFPAPPSALWSLALPAFRRGGPCHMPTYPWGQAQPERQGPWAGTLRFSSCCSHVLSLLSSGAVCRSLQFTKTWPSGQAVAGGEEGGCWQELGCSAGCLEHGPWGGILGARGGQGDLGTRQLEDAGREGAVLLSGPCLGSQMHIIEGGRAVGCHTRQPPPLPAPRVPCSLHQRLFRALHMHFITESCNNSGRYDYFPFPI